MDTHPFFTAAKSSFLKAKRTTPKWSNNLIDTNTTVRSCEMVQSVINGIVPIGILPIQLLSKSECAEVLEGLKEIKQKKYDNTTNKEKVLVYGDPFVDFPSLDEYLNSAVNPVFEDLTTPILERVCSFYKSLGFTVKPLIDSLTGLPYKSKVVREISVPEGCIKEDNNRCTVAHCDDILRDGFLKPDFRLPVGVTPGNYEQFSVCVQLDDGGYRPDHLKVMEQKFTPELLPEFNGWRAPKRISEETRFAIHVPQVKEAYMFSTLMIHDVQGGHPKSKRINFSVFFVAVGNTLYYYN